MVESQGEKFMKQFYCDGFLFEVHVDILRRYGYICFIKIRDKTTWMKLEICESDDKLIWTKRMLIEGEPPKDALKARSVL